MKRVFYSGMRMLVTKAIASFVISSVFICSSVQAQTTYLSTFSSPTGNYSASNATCVLGVNAPDLVGSSNIASGTLTDYASLTAPGGLSITLLCGPYRLRTKLNLGGLSSIPASPTVPYYAGFRVSSSSLAQLNLLGGSNGSNFVVRTYLNGNLVQSVSGLPLGLGLLQAGTPGNVYFAATEPFNEVGVDIAAGILDVGAISELRFYYGYASSVPNPVILPVKLSSFAASAEGKGVKLNWISASESNLASYELERSSNAGVSFEKVTSVTAKGSNASQANYSYLDGSVAGGDYSYRLKMIDKDGRADYSKIVSVKIAASGKWKIYPTLLSSGANLNVNFSANTTEKSQVQLTNLQGQVLQSISTTDSKLVVPTGNLSVGVYVLKLYRNGQLQASEKVIVQ